MTTPAPAPVGACDWPIVYPATCTVLDGLSPEQREAYEQAAADYLWRWTGQTFGLCPVSIRPCRADCDQGGKWFWGNGPFPPGFATDNLGGRWTPALINGTWVNLGCGSCGSDGCSCDFVPSVRLPGPMAAVDQVLVDGAALPQDSYRIDNAVLLVRTDGGDWPSCQDMAAATTEINTWQVDYQLGQPVPIGGQVAAGALACELAKAAVGDSSCQLPRRVQTIARQGVTMSFLDSMEDLDKGRTGIWLIDSWVASVMNPPRASTVRSPDIPSPRHRVTTWVG